MQLSIHAKKMVTSIEKCRSIGRPKLSGSWSLQTLYQGSCSTPPPPLCGVAPRRSCPAEHSLPKRLSRTRVYTAHVSCTDITVAMSETVNSNSFKWLRFPTKAAKISEIKTISERYYFTDSWLWSIQTTKGAHYQPRKRPKAIPKRVGEVANSVQWAIHALIAAVAHLHHICYNPDSDLIPPHMREWMPTLLLNRYGVSISSFLSYLN